MNKDEDMREEKTRDLKKVPLYYRSAGGAYCLSGFISLLEYAGDEVLQSF